MTENVGRSEATSLKFESQSSMRLTRMVILTSSISKSKNLLFHHPDVFGFEALAGWQSPIAYAIVPLEQGGRGGGRQR